MPEELTLKGLSVAQPPVYVEHAYDLADAIWEARSLKGDAAQGHAAFKRVCILTREVNRWFYRVWTDPDLKPDAAVLLKLLRAAYELLDEAFQSKVNYLPDGDLTVDVKTHIEQMRQNVNGRITLMEKIDEGDLSWSHQFEVGEYVREQGDAAKSEFETLLAEKYLKAKGSGQLTRA